jgi:hypothetical protein
MSLIFGFGAIVLGGLLSLFALVFYFFVLVDCAKNESEEGNTKIVWILIILFTAPLGGIIYYLIRRPERLTTLGR